MTSCTGVHLSKWHFPYTMTIQQGRYITNDEYESIKNGITKEQVADIIGYPLSQYMFNQNVWYFMYQKHKNNHLYAHYTITIVFDDTNRVLKKTKTGNLMKND